MKRLLFLAFLIAAVTLTNCAREHRPPNIVLITVDTLRPDHLHYSGNVRNTSPCLDRLSQQGIVFTNASSVSGWTLPSMAIGSMATTVSAFSAASAT